MAPRLAALLRPPIGFAHRGGATQGTPNTLSAFTAALAMGATGLESDARLTADNVVVLHHDSRVRFAPRRGGGRRVSETRRCDLPEGVVSLEEFYRSCGGDFEFSVDVKDPAAASGLVDAARLAGDQCASRLWLCSDSLDRLERWRERWSDVRLVLSTRRRLMERGPEALAARMARHGIDAVNMPHADWTGGTAVLFHRFELLAFGWGARHDRTLGELLDAGLDAVYCDDVALMMKAIARYYQ